MWSIGRPPIQRRSKAAASNSLKLIVRCAIRFWRVFGNVSFLAVPAMNEVGVIRRTVLNAVVIRRAIRYCPPQNSAGRKRAGPGRQTIFWKANGEGRTVGISRRGDGTASERHLSGQARER